MKIGSPRPQRCNRLFLHSIIKLLFLEVRSQAYEWRLAQPHEQVVRIADLKAEVAGLRTCRHWGSAASMA